MLKARIHITRRDGSNDVLHFPFQPFQSTVEDLIEFVEEIHRDKMSIDSSLSPSNFQLDYSKVCFDTKFPDQLVEGTKLQIFGSTEQDLAITEVREQNEYWSLKNARVLELPLQPYHVQSPFFMKEVGQIESVKLFLSSDDYIDIDKPSLLNAHIPLKEILANVEESLWMSSHCMLSDGVHLDVDLPLKRMNLHGQCIAIHHAKEKFEVKIKSMSGKTITLSCDTSMTVFDLKKEIHDKEGIPPDQQRLMFDGSQLEEDRFLSDYGIGEGCTIHIVLRLRGGMYHPTSGRSDNDEEKVTISLILPNGKERSCCVSASCDESAVKEIAIMHLLKEMPETIITDAILEERRRHILKELADIEELQEERKQPTDSSNSCSMP